MNPKTSKLVAMVLILGLCMAGALAFAQEQDKPKGDGEKAEPKLVQKKLLKAAPKKMLKREKVLELVQPARKKGEKKAEAARPGVVILEGVERTKVIELPGAALKRAELKIELRDGKIVVNGRVVAEAATKKVLTVTVVNGKVYVNGKEVGEIPNFLKKIPIPDTPVPIPVPGKLRTRILRLTPDGWKGRVEKLLKREGQWRPVLPFGGEGKLPGKPGLERLLTQLKALRRAVDRMIDEVEHLKAGHGPRLRVLPRIEKQFRIVPKRLKGRVIEPQRLRRPGEKKIQKARKDDSSREDILRRIEKLIERKLDRSQPEKDDTQRDKEK